MKSSVVWMLLVLGAGHCLVRAAKPDYCGDYDCPAFTSVDMGTYEIRTYEPTHWLVTSVTSSDQEASRRQKMAMFWKLFAYFRGKNSAGQRVKMAVPSLSKVVTNEDSNNFEIHMMFYVSDRNPPTPTTEGVTLVSLPSVEMFVRDFQMYTLPSKERILLEVDQLKTDIQNDNSNNIYHLQNSFYSSAYQYPFSAIKKQYEVWIQK